jgi:uncharacterized protein YndB with AHSA1/START domain
MAEARKNPNSDPLPDAEEPVLRLSRSFQAPREAVFRAFTDPAEMAKWWGPKGFTVPVCELDARPGGAWRTCMRDPDGGVYCVGGVYREVVPPQRLVFTWAWEDDGKPGHETLVVIELATRGGGTTLTLTQQRFETIEGRDKHAQGWSSSFDCLDAYLAGGSVQ